MEFSQKPRVLIQNTTAIKALMNAMQNMTLGHPAQVRDIYCVEMMFIWYSQITLDGGSLNAWKKKKKCLRVAGKGICSSPSSGNAQSAP